MTLHRAHEQPVAPQRGMVLRASVVLGAAVAAHAEALLLGRVALDVFALVATLLGVAMLWRAWRATSVPRPTTRLVGGMLVGAGATCIVGLVAPWLYVLALGIPFGLSVAHQRVRAPGGRRGSLTRA